MRSLFSGSGEGDVSVMSPGHESGAESAKSCASGFACSGVALKKSVSDLFRNVQSIDKDFEIFFRNG
ncbi:MAG: hypothetical protein ACOCPN_00075, partial [Desulfonatronovibrionaceae bacterium]